MRRRLPSTAAGIRRQHRLTPDLLRIASTSAVRGIVHNRELCAGGAGKILDFESRKPGIDRNGAGAELPDGEQLGEKFQPVAEGQEHAVSGESPRL